MSNPRPGSAGVSRAVVLMTAGCALLTVNDAIMKSLTADYPTGETIFVRGLFVAIPIALLVHRGGGLQTLRVTNLRGQLLRAALLAGSMFLFITSLRFLPLADAIALTFAGPLIVTAVAPWALGERVGRRRRCAVGVGFAGVLVMLAPGEEGLRWVALLALATAFFEAARDIVTRRLVATESSLSLTAFSLGFVTLCALATAGHGWRPMRAEEIGLLAMAGCCVSIAFLLMTEAFRHAEASLVAPFRYSSVLWAALTTDGGARCGPCAVRESERRDPETRNPPFVPRIASFRCIGKVIEGGDVGLHVHHRASHPVAQAWRSIRRPEADGGPARGSTPRSTH